MLLGVVHSVWRDLATSLLKLIPGNMLSSMAGVPDEPHPTAPRAIGPKSWAAGKLAAMSLVVRFEPT
jgi:hypothetical protein